MTWIGILIFAFVLSCFEMDTVLMAGLNEILNSHYSTNVYWLIVFVIATIAGLIELYHNSKR